MAQGGVLDLHCDRGCRGDAANGGAGDGGGKGRSTGAEQSGCMVQGARDSDVGSYQRSAGVRGVAPVCVSTEGWKPGRGAEGVLCSWRDDGSNCLWNEPVCGGRM